MRQAILEARQAARKDEVPVGAVLVDCNGSLLARAHNQMVTLCDPTAHAEILAIRSASRVIGNYRLLDTCLYVTVEPCIMCMGAISLARVGTLVYGAGDPKGGAAGSCCDLAANPCLNHIVEVHGGVLEEECRNLIQAFFQRKREK